MTKKDYERAATIAQCIGRNNEVTVDAFVALFTFDNPRFNEVRFRAACVPGANVKAQPRKEVA